MYLLRPSQNIFYTCDISIHKYLLFATRPSHNVLNIMCIDQVTIYITIVPNSSHCVLAIYLVTMYLLCVPRTSHNVSIHIIYVLRPSHNVLNSSVYTQS